MYPFKIERAPEPQDFITTAEVVAYLRAIPEIDTELITDLIEVACEMVEDYCRIAIRTQEIEAWYDDPTIKAYIPFPPQLTITGVFDAEDEEIDYQIYGGKQRLITVNDVGVYVIKYTAGMETVPARLKNAIMRFTAYLYEHRGDAQMEIPKDILVMLSAFYQPAI